MQDIYAYHCSGFRQEIGGTQGRIQKIQKGVARTLASFMDTFYFTENSLKVIEKITEKGVAMGPLCPTPKSIHLQIGTKQEALPGGSPMSPV